MARSVYMAMCPNAVHLVSLAAPYQRVKDNRAAYHIGAYFLTGEQRKEVDDEIAADALGRVGVFL